MRLRGGFSIVLGLLLSTAAWSAPSDKGAPDARVQQARVYFNVGLDHFQQGEYEAAIVAFQTGYRIKPMPLFLFNIAQSARKAKKTELAIDYYQQYIALEGTSGAQPVAEAQVQLDLLRREQASATPPVTPPPPSMNLAPMPPAGPSLSAASSPSPTPGDRPLWKRTWFWGAIAGVVVAGTAVGLGVGLGVHGGAPQPSLGAVTF